MKVVRLRVAGFGPYRREQTIDFRPFDEAGIFLITGRTGAGKSSILDAICFALYGGVPRFDGRDLGVRSQHCTPDEETFAELDFTVRGTTYRIRQSPKYERPSRRGGMTTQAAAVSLSIEEDGEWRTLATKAGEVGALLQEVLPLRRDQFLQVILLAQGRFQDFLLAPTGERRAVLRTLFRTERFETLEAALQDRRRELEGRAAVTERELAAHAAAIAAQAGFEEPIEPDLDWFETAWTALTDRMDAAAAETGRAEVAAAAAERALQEVQSLEAAQRRRDEAQAALDALVAEEPAVQDLRSALERADLAERVRPLLERRDAAVRDRTAATSARATAEAAWRALQPDADARVAADGLLTAIGALEPALEAERDLERRREAALAAAAVLEAADAELAALRARAAELPVALQSLEPALAAAGALAAGAAERAARVTELEAVAAAATRAAALATEAEAAAAAHAEASAAHLAAAAAYDALVRRRLTGAAAVLAADLVPGMPCAVCGSVEHPAPATSHDLPPSDADLESAALALERARGSLDDAAAAATEVLRRLDASRAAAGGRSATDAAADLAVVRARAADAERARADAARLERERAAIREELARVGAELERAATDRDGLAEAATRADAAAREAAAGIETARAGFPSVAARRDRLRAEQEAARAAVRAGDLAATAERAAVDAEDALALQLAVTGFDEESGLREALLSDQARAERQRAVRAHEDALVRVRGVLAEPALAGLPAARIDAGPAVEADRAARIARDEALAAAAAAQDRLDLVTARLDGVRRLLAAGRRLREEYLRVRELAAVVSGGGSNTMRMRLETYVLAAYLEDVLAAANLRLGAMTGRRYALVLDDGRQHRNVETGLGVTVLDAHTGERRQAASLSGGETFLASLALALGLAEVVSAQAGGVRLDTLFVDEGFGSLDAETLDVALAALEDLRTGGRTIGLISHVESMRERIPAKLAVTVLPTGESAVEPTTALV